MRRKFSLRDDNLSCNNFYVLFLQPKLPFLHNLSVLQIAPTLTTFCHLNIFSNPSAFAARNGDYSLRASCLLLILGSHNKLNIDFVILKTCAFEKQRRDSPRRDVPSPLSLHAIASKSQEIVFINNLSSWLLGETLQILRKHIDVSVS